MILYRITSPSRAFDLSGTGAKLYGGRWNSVGNPVVYASGTASLAMLEIMANAEAEWLKRSFSLNILSIPDHLHIERIKPKSLPEDWKNFPYDTFTVDYGDRWLSSRMSPLLQVPSAINPFEFNYLLNPNHKDFEMISIEEVRDISFDLRLVP